MADLDTKCLTCDVDITVFEDNAENEALHYCAPCLKVQRG